MQEERVKADVLCIGGGIAGLMAAIRASEQGARVVVAEKGNALASGRGRSGNDHFETYIPEVHGADRDAWIDELLRTAKGEVPLGRAVLRAQFEKAFDIVQLWDSWGIPMRYQGHWEFAGHSFPGRPMTHIKYGGRFQKKILVREARRRGVEILNRVMVTQLLCDANRVIGAAGVHTREEKIVVFEARAVILATGKCSRLYPGITPGLMFNDAHGGGQTGDGRAMAFRAGVRLHNVEMPQCHIGPRYFPKFGQATWVGVLKDGEGRPLGTFAPKPDRKYGDMVMEVNKQIARDTNERGQGPVYMDCTGISEADLDYMRHWMVHEGNVSLFKHLEAEGIDVRRHPIEFETYPLRFGGMVLTNERAETDVAGLFAAGDEAHGDISAAATFGWISGENAASFAAAAGEVDADRDRPAIERLRNVTQSLLGRAEGPDWEDANLALQQTLQDYAGRMRNQKRLEQGLFHLRRLKEKAYTTLMARNSHELFHCLETLNMFDLGELVLLGALDRKETRDLHVRPEYAFTNPLLNQAHIVQKREGRTVLYWRPY